MLSKTRAIVSLGLWLPAVAGYRLCGTKALISRSSERLFHSHGLRMTESVRKHVDYQSLVPAPKRPHMVLSDAPKRLIVVGDVHGCLEELQQLLVESNYNKNEGDEVLLVGDLVNKGPLSAETVQFARENNFHCIRGNHDDFALCHALQLVEKSTHPGLQYIEKLTQ